MFSVMHLSPVLFTLFHCADQSAYFLKCVVTEVQSLQSIPLLLLRHWY